MSKNIIVYLDRDNKAKVLLKKNGKTVEQGVVTKVDLAIPEGSFVGGVGQEVSTDTIYMSLTNNDTEVIMSLSTLPLKVGKHPARITVYDVSTTIGFAWDDITLDVRNWDI